MKYIVIGNSAAGLFAVEEIRKHDTQSEIIVLTKDEEPSYSRCLTTYFLAGDIPDYRLYLRDSDFLQRLKLTIVYGVEIQRIDPENQRVQSTDGREWEYGKLLLAMGASAKKLSIKGGTLPEVFTLRNLQDALRINEVIEGGAQKAVVIGGGLVSLKSAYALKKRGLDVTAVISSPQILSQMLNQKAAHIIQKHLEAHGLKFLLNTSPEAITGKDRVRGVLIPPDSALPADLVIIGKGVKPNVGALNNPGFKIGRGLQVDAYMATSLPNIFAAGDIAETWDLVRREYTVNATWPNAAAQGRIAGANMCGQREPYPGSLSFNSVDFFGLAAMSVGITRIPANEPHNHWSQDESLSMIDGRPSYQCLIWQGNVLKGFTLMGETSQGGILTALLKAGRPFSHGEKVLARTKRGSLAVGQILNRKAGDNRT